MQYPVRHGSRLRGISSHRSERAVVAQLGAGLEGDGLSVGADCGQAGSWIWPDRTEEFDDWCYDGMFRACPRLRRGQVPSVGSAEVSASKSPTWLRHEIGR